MNYRLWTEMAESEPAGRAGPPARPVPQGGRDSGEPRLKEDVLEKIDRAVEMGRKHGIHMDLNFHRAPGYSVSREVEEPFCLWTDQEALDAFCFHWAHFAKRYKGIPSRELSFNLVNEPADIDEKGLMTRENHEKVARAALKAIHDVDPDRLVIADGVRWGNDPLPELADTAMAQSCRGYVPMQISHYQAPWVNGERFEKPSWPTKDQGEGVYDRERLEEHFGQWRDLVKQGVGVHCGECGCFSKTPHEVFLAWFEDFLQILTDSGIGWALWGFRSSFGILDSQREDVDYEDWHGHKLDRKLLDLLLRY
ncbi:glycoside hydrolase family 5 protein [Verrucomicrobiota bacterium]